MAIKTLSATVDAGSSGRVDRVVRQLTGSSHGQVRGLFDHCCVTINSTPCENGAAAVSSGDVVAVRFDPTQRYKEKKKRWDDRTFTVNFEDDYLIVVDKSAGTLTVPTDRQEANTLDQRVSIYLSHSRKKSDAWIVHRLDRDVSGLLVFGKQESVADLLIEQFRQHKPERVYAAIVAGVVSNDQGTFHSQLATGKNLDRYVAPKSRETETAITHYRVLQRMEDATLVEVHLETGKRNQIRVHFANAGHPVLGDPRYRKELARHDRWRRKRIALHAISLGFTHPVTEVAMKFESPLPPPMQKFLNHNR